MTFEQAVEKISKKFLKKAGKVSDFNAEICLTDDDCKGVFSIRVSNGKVAVEPYDYYECDVRITCTYDNFIKFISDEEATYNLQCRSKRFADILAVVRKQPKTEKKEEATEVKEESKPSRCAKRAVKTEDKSAKTVKKTAVKKTAVKTEETKETAVKAEPEKTETAVKTEPEKTETKPAESKTAESNMTAAAPKAVSSKKEKKK